ncbi:MAG: hypothetical protein IJW29_07975 [Clostridia bacterium]|nr:hypothetical protein [Clostridia bacterium]
MKKKLILTALYATSGTAILAAAVLQTLSVLLAFDTGSNYFVTGAPLPTAALIAALVGGAVGILAACLSPRKRETDPSPFPASIYTALPTALVFLLFGVFLLVSVGATDTARSLRIPAALLSIVAAAYTLVSAIPAWRKSHASAIALLGFTAPLACALANAYYYFDLSVEMNSPVKYCVQVSLLFAMLYFLGELRYLIGEPKPRLFVSGAACALAAASLCAIAFPVALFTGTIARLDYAMGGYLALGMAIGIGFRAFPVIRSFVTPTETQKEDDCTA